MSEMLHTELLTRKMRSSCCKLEFKLHTQSYNHTWLTQTCSSRSQQLLNSPHSTNSLLAGPYLNGLAKFRGTALTTRSAASLNCFCYAKPSHSSRVTTNHATCKSVITTSSGEHTLNLLVRMTLTNCYLRNLLGCDRNLWNLLRCCQNLWSLLDSRRNLCSLSS